MYSLLVNVYSFGVKLCAVFSNKARLWIEGRKNWQAHLKSLIDGYDKWIWFHCASLGEFEDGRIIIEETKKRYPNHRILITFFSPSAFEAKKNDNKIDAIFYLPIDTLFNANLFVEIVSPELAVFIRNDIWINYLKVLKEKGIPVVLLSFNMNEKSSFIKWPQQNFYKKAFSLFDKIVTQNQQTAELLNKSFKISNTLVSGNFRINSICERFRKNVLLETVEKFVADDFCVIAGSALYKEQQLIVNAYNHISSKKIKWIIVPHEINTSTIGSMVLKNEKMIRYSEINKLTPNHDFLWIDNVGMLAMLYKYADVAFVGGGFNKIGIHNILEPAVFGCPIIFGPNHRNYKEALELIDTGGAQVVNNQTELEQLIFKFYADKELVSEIMKKNSAYVFDRKVDVEPIFNMLNGYLLKDGLKC